MKKKELISGFVIFVALVATALLLPGLINAGNLEPSAAPAPTMRTLEEVQPTWSKKIPCDSTSNCPRFEVLADFNDEAVLDKETGLVWEQAPSTTALDWATSFIHCNNIIIGGREGWHLPTFEQLASLVDSSQSNPTLPSGHPFTNVQLSEYWSATTDNYDTNYARAVYFVNGGMSNGSKNPLLKHYVWCVRGGQSYDAY